MSEPTNGTKAKLDEHTRRLDQSDQGRERLWASVDELNRWRAGKDVEMTHLATSIGRIEGDLSALRSEITTGLASNARAAYVRAAGFFTLAAAIGGTAAALLAG